MNCNLHETVFLFKIEVIANCPKRTTSVFSVDLKDVASLSIILNIALIKHPNLLFWEIIWSLLLWANTCSESTIKTLEPFP